MIHKTIKLDLPYLKYGLSNNLQEVTLTTYLLDDIGYKRQLPLIIICPGGGFNHLSKREAEPVALRFNSKGYHAAVLRYSLSPMDFPCAMLDLAVAMHYIKENASSMQIDPNKIIVAGFSAGSHVAASLCCYWDSSLISKYLPYKTEKEKEELRPFAALLCYPVITAKKDFCHEGSVKAYCKDSEEAKKLFSLEDHVTKFVPPTFIWHTTEDEAVPMENSMLYANALKKQNIPFEYHLFGKGKHGLALADSTSSASNGEHIQKECAIWVELFFNWLNNL